MKKIVRPASVTPFFSLCMIVRDNEGTLPPLLESVKDTFDEFVFVDTGSVDKTLKVLAAFAKDNPRKKVVVQNAVWTDDFSAARNISLLAASGRWRMFLDSDDVLENGAKLRAALPNIEKNHPYTEGLFLPYDYAPDEQLWTMRVVKYRPGWAFVDAIHERLEFQGPGIPDNALLHFKQTVVHHKYKTDPEKIAAIERNNRIAERDYPTADPRYKARLARTLAQKQKMDMNLDAAEPLLKEVYHAYPDFPEGRQAAADLMQCNMARAVKAPKEEYMAYIDKAGEWANLAGISYRSMIAYERGDFEGCLALQRQATADNQTTHEGWHREQCVARAVAAHAALRLIHQGKVADREAELDRIEFLLNGIAPHQRNNPAYLGLMYDCRAELNTITIMVPWTPTPFDEKSPYQQFLGGSEEAVVYLATELARQGRRVRVHAPLPNDRKPGRDENGVDWQPLNMFNLDDEVGHLVLWRAPNVALDIAKRKQSGSNQAPGILGASLWLHDCEYPMAPEVFQAACNVVDNVIVVSEFHKQVLQRRMKWDGNKAVVLGNGVVAEQFPALQAQPNPTRVVYSSCPTRGLVNLLQYWPAVKAAVPTAQLDIYYDWTGAERANPDFHKELVVLYKSVQHLDVKHHGGVSQPRLNEIMRDCGVWAYPHTGDSETFCITAVKAHANGCAPVCTDAGALASVVTNKVDQVTEADIVAGGRGFREALVRRLRNPLTLAERQAQREQALDQHGWAVVGGLFGAYWSLHDPKNKNAPVQHSDADAAGPVQD